MTFTPTDPFPPAFCHSIPSFLKLSIVLLLLASRVGPQAEQVQAAVMVALLTHTHMHGHTQGRRVGCGTTLSEMADQDCLLEGRKSSALVVFRGLSRE